MDSQLSEPIEFLARLRESVRQGNWENAERMAGNLARHTPPKSREGLEEYLLQLRETLIAAKCWRANAMTSLVRLQAAGKFNSTGRDLSRHRQNSVDSADF